MSIQGLNPILPKESLTIENWSIEPSQHWGVFVTHHQVAEWFTQWFYGDKPLAQRFFREPHAHIGIVSLHEQQRLLDDELAKDDTDFMDRIDYGSTVEALIQEVADVDVNVETLLDQLDLQHLRQRGFRQLSTGETRRLMLARALATQPTLLVLEEPFSGLDILHRKMLSELLNSLSSTIQIILIISREEDLPDCITHLALFQEQTLAQTMTVDEWKTHPVVQQLSALSEQRSDAFLTLVEQGSQGQPYPDPVLRMNNVAVEYTDQKIFSQLTWEVHQNEHWQIRGPNGCGKSTLLGLIIGDHPQCYCNDIEVLGIKRGSGESIWDVKRHIGMVSSSLHLAYRVNCPALEVLISGFYDSIGLYQQPTAKEIATARAWLVALEMLDYQKVSFRALDYGQQRLLLIARSLIKNPALLILDEPYQGLDFLSRSLVIRVLDKIAASHLTQILYVTHYEEDRLHSIANFLDFVSDPEGGYQIQLTRQS